MRIILDTNFLLIPEKYHVNIFSEMQRIAGKTDLFMVKPSKRELKRLSDTKTQDGRAAKVGLQLLNHKNVTIIDTDEHYADKAILDYENKDAVATQDRKLRKKLLEQKTPVITMRKNQYLILVRP